MNFASYSNFKAASRDFISVFDYTYYNLKIMPCDALKTVTEGYTK